MCRYIGMYTQSPQTDRPYSLYIIIRKSSLVVIDNIIIYSSDLWSKYPNSQQIIITVYIMYDVCCLYDTRIMIYQNNMRVVLCCVFVLCRGVGHKPHDLLTGV